MIIIIIDAFWQGNYAEFSGGRIIQQKVLLCGNLYSFSRYF